MICTLCNGNGASTWKDGQVSHMTCRMEWKADNGLIKVAPEKPKKNQ